MDKSITLPLFCLSIHENELSGATTVSKIGNVRMRDQTSSWLQQSARPKNKLLGRQLSLPRLDLVADLRLDSSLGYRPWLARKNKLLDHMEALRTDLIPNSRYLAVAAVREEVVWRRIGHAHLLVTKTLLEKRTRLPVLKDRKAAR
ncbi:hypothetical protein B0H11DRAFT_2183013 [Mycena galericulata]|nr:hypothetical protein B0H11DRAFT_2183013 [Mycena galericulata]